MTRMAGPDCALMYNFINTHTHTHTREHHYLVQSLTITLGSERGKYLPQKPLRQRTRRMQAVIESWFKAADTTGIDINIIVVLGEGTKRRVLRDD